MHKAFAATALSDGGIERSEQIRLEFSGLLHWLEEALPKSRELSLVTTKLEEAAFFAQRANALADVLSRGPDLGTCEPPPPTSPGG